MASFRSLILAASTLAQGATLRLHLQNLNAGGGGIVGGRADLVITDNNETIAIKDNNEIVTIKSESIGIKLKADNTGLKL